MAVVLKFAFNGEFRRARIGALTWEEVARAVPRAFPELCGDSFDLKYYDDEDDLCLLSPATFSDFVELYGQASSIRLEATRRPQPATPAPPPPLQPSLPTVAAGCGDDPAGSERPSSQPNQQTAVGGDAPSAGGDRLSVQPDPTTAAVGAGDAPIHSGEQLSLQPSRETAAMGGDSPSGASDRLSVEPGPQMAAVGGGDSPMGSGGGDHLSVQSGPPTAAAEGGDAPMDSGEQLASGGGSLRYEAPAPAAGGDVPACGSERPASGEQPERPDGPVPGPLPGLLKALLCNLQLAGGEALAALLLHFTPRLLQHVQGAGGEIDKAVAERPELARAALQALREGLEPFPQLQEAQMVMDRALEAEQLTGVGAAVQAFLQQLVQLPFEQQRDIASVALGRVVERLLQLVPEGLSAAADGWVHHYIECNGCGASPILGPRFKCDVCPDYDLCGACYMQKDALHPAHAFHCEPLTRGKGCGKGWAHCAFEGWAKPLLGAWAKAFGVDCGKGWKGWGKGWNRICGKGKGKGAGKGWGKGWGMGWSLEGSDTSTSDSNNGSSSSSGSEGSKPRRHARRAARRDLRAAKQAWRKAKREAREQWRVAKKAWKEERRQARAARHARSRLERQGLRLHLSGRAAEVPPAEAPDFAFPVHVEDGRRLTLSWRRGDAPEEVATLFALQHGIPADELPAIAGFIRQAEAVCGGEASVADPPEPARPQDEGRAVGTEEPAEGVDMMEDEQAEGVNEERKEGKEMEQEQGPMQGADLEVEKEKEAEAEAEEEKGTAKEAGEAEMDVSEPAASALPADAALEDLLRALEARGTLLR